MKTWKIGGLIYDEKEEVFIDFIAQKRADDTGRPAIVELSTDGGPFKPITTIYPSAKVEEKKRAALEPSVDLFTTLAKATKPAGGTISKKDMVKMALASGERIRPLDEEGKPSFGTTRLADIIFKLRKEGIPVETETVEVVDRFGGICQVAEYSIKTIRD